MESIVIPVASMKSASDALLNRISHAAIKPGEPIFRPVDQHQHIGSTRLTDRSGSNIIKARVLRYARKNGNTKTSAKAMAAGFSGHSLALGSSRPPHAARFLVITSVNTHGTRVCRPSSATSEKPINLRIWC